MRRTPFIGGWSSFPDRVESLFWASLGLAVGAIAIALTITQ